MNFTLDPDSKVTKKSCPNCKREYLDMRYLIEKDGDAYAIAFIECHRHDDEPTIFITCVLGTWDDDETADRFTFTCMYGNIEGAKDMACALLDPPDSYSAQLTGKKLTRIEALDHERLNDFWEVVDYLTLSDKTIHDYIHHQELADT